ncbi:MAG TPA: nuclear transport factor 2 family protein [Nevskia sp.]|nr:nuclear transport factor 2 family protein [Nevskia sp.]
MPDSDLSQLVARIDRLESTDQIRQLAAKYALALDMRDADAWVGLFPADIQVGNGESGRAALRRWFDQTMRGQFTGTAHHIGGTSSSSSTRTMRKAWSIPRTNTRPAASGSSCR